MTTQDGSRGASRTDLVPIGSIEVFDEGDDEWDLYVERLDQYFEANGITDAGRKRGVLLTVCGKRTYKLVRDLVSQDKPADKTYDELCEVLSKHSNPKPREVVQRCAFFSRHRQSGETVADFVAGLRRLAADCNFGPALDDMLRDRLVSGVNNDRIQRRLLAESGALDLTKTLELAVAVERATHDAARLQSTQLRSTDQVHWVRQGQRGRARGKDDEEGRHCFRCGSRLHDEGKCRFRKEKCYQCGKTGHIRRMCRQKNAAGVGQAGQERHKQGQRVFSVTNESSDSSSDGDHDGMYYLCRVGENELGRVSTDPITVSVVLDGQSTEMEIDTGPVCRSCRRVDSRNFGRRKSVPS